MDGEWHIVGADGDSTDGSQACSRPCTPAAALYEGVAEGEAVNLEKGEGAAEGEIGAPPCTVPPALSDAAPGAGVPTALPSASGDTSAPCCSSTEVASPASERLADSVLGQPFPPPSTVNAQPADKPSPIAALSPFQGQAASGPPASPRAGQDEAVVGVRSQELETMMGLQELSGEGSLEGFHDFSSDSDDDQNGGGGSSTHRGSRAENEGGAGAQRSGGPLGLLSWIEHGLGALSSFLAQLPSRLAGVWRSCTAELQEEVSELRRVLAATRQYLGQEVGSVTKGSGKVAKSVKRRIPRASTLVPFLCVSTAVACCGLVHFMVRCRRLNHSMLQREREYTLLLLKCVNLQEALRQQLKHHRPNAVTTPVLRHTGIVPTIAVSSCML